MSLYANVNSRVAIYMLVGFSLVGIVFITPDAGHHVGDFLNIARSSPWNRFFDLAAAWCSLKIILLGAGLFLLIESIWTILARLKHCEMVVLFFGMQILLVLGMLAGGYYFLPALL